ncbi:MAG: hypothetical protein VCA18_05640 [Opitutales bacterium]
MKKKHRDKLIIVLMEKLYGGKDSCPNEFQSLMDHLQRAGSIPWREPR